MNPSNDVELADLHHRLIEDELDGQGMDRLRVLLQDPLQRRRLRGLMRTDGLLCELHRPGTVSTSARMDVQRHGLMPTIRASRPWVWIVAAAAMLLLTGAGWWWSAQPAVLPVVARWTSGDRPVVRGGDTVIGPGELALVDGSRITLDAGTNLMVVDRESGLRLSVNEGAVRVIAAQQTAGHELSVATDHVEVAVVGTRFRVEREADGTRIAVDDGRVSVRPLSRPAMSLIAGEVIRVAADGAIQPLPAIRWHVDLSNDAERQGWFGSFSPDGLGLTFDAKTSRDYSIPTWNIQMPDPGTRGVAGFAAAGWCEWDVRVDRPATIAMQFQMWNQAGDRWLGTVQREVSLSAGRHHLRWPLASFVAKQGADIDALVDMPIRRCAVIAWEDAGIVVERIAVLPGE